MSFFSREFQINQDFELTNPDLHDCEIVELKTSRGVGGRTLIVQLIKDSGPPIHMTLTGAVLIYCTAFRIQNVVSHVRLYSGVDCTRELQELEGIETTQEITESLNAKIRDGGYALVRLVPSVGCDIYCVCKQVEII